MSKNKNTLQLPSIDKVGEVAQQVGVILMTAAVTLGMTEMAQHINGRVVLPAQAALKVEAEAPAGGGEGAIRREREEAGPHYVNYSVTQRTASRSGKQ